MTEGTTTTGPSPQERNLAMACHLSSFAGFVVPFGNLAGPLIVWLIKRVENPYVDDQGKEAVNFQISLTIYMVVSFALMLIIVGFFLAIGLTIFWIVVTIQAAIRANRGEPYRYPLTIRLIK